MKLNKTIVLSASICGLALTAVAAGNTVFAADTTATTTTVAKTQEAKVDYSSNFGIAVWSEPGKKVIPNKYERGQSTIKVSASKTIEKTTWYQLADGSGWVDGQYLKFTPATTDTKPSQNTAKKTINLVKGTVTVSNDKGAVVYANADTTPKTVNRVLGKNTEWKAFREVSDGTTKYYNLGGNQWVLASDVTASWDVKKDTSTDKNKPADNTNYTIVSKKVITIENTKGAFLYSNPDNETKTNRVLGVGTQWKTFYEKDNGKLWYNVGTNQWVLASDTVAAEKPANKENNTNSSANTQSVDATPISGVATIHYVPGYGIRVWGQPGANALNKTLKHGTSWKVFKVTKVNGKTWYNVGGNQWIDGSYVTLKNVITPLAASFATVNYVPGYGIAVWTAPNGQGHTTGKTFPNNDLLNVLAINENGDWSKVEDSLTGISGWVPTRYLKTQKIGF